MRKPGKSGRAVVDMNAEVCSINRSIDPGRHLCTRETTSRAHAIDRSLMLFFRWRTSWENALSWESTSGFDRVRAKSLFPRVISSTEKHRCEGNTVLPENLSICRVYMMTGESSCNAVVTSDWRSCNAEYLIAIGWNFVTIVIPSSWDIFSVCRKRNTHGRSLRCFAVTSLPEQYMEIFRVKTLHVSTFAQLSKNWKHSICQFSMKA